MLRRESNPLRGATPVTSMTCLIGRSQRWLANQLNTSYHIYFIIAILILIYFNFLIKKKSNCFRSYSSSKRFERTQIIVIGVAIIYVIQKLNLIGDKTELLTQLHLNKSAPGGSRTHTSQGQRILSPQRLPFRHRCSIKNSAT